MSNNTTFQFLSQNDLCFPNHGSTADGRKMDSSHVHASSFFFSIIIAVLSPVAVVGNALILAAIWRRNFQRTPFKVLLSGLAFTDFCTGLIAQPFTAATDLLHLALDCTNRNNRTLSLITMDAIGDASATYFISTTALIITVIGLERWLHMTGRSSMTKSPCGYFIVFVLLIIPIPVVVSRTIETVKGNPAFEFNITIIAAALFCLLTTSVAYFKVLRIIRRHQQQVRAAERAHHFGQAAINLEKYKKSVSTILYVLALFYCCFVPFIISIRMYIYVGDESHAVAVTLDVTTTLLFLSSSLNPCLYLWRMNDIRSGVKQLFCSENVTEM